MNGRKLGPAQLVIAVAGAVVLVGSFLDFYEDTSAWGEGAFPLMVLPAIAGVVMAAHVLLTAFGVLELPARVAGLDWVHLHLVLGAYAAVLMVGFLVGEAGFLGLSPDRAIGFWLMLVGSIGLLAGAVMKRNEGSSGMAGGA